MTNYHKLGYLTYTHNDSLFKSTNNISFSSHFSFSFVNTYS